MHKIYLLGKKKFKFKFYFFIQKLILWVLVTKQEDNSYIMRKEDIMNK